MPVYITVVCFSERDDGYHSGDNEWDNQHGRVFYLDEELAVLARRVRSDDNIPFPDYLFVPDVTIAGPSEFCGELF